jgi:DNA-binding beta-propeller fold protein YncE
MSSAPTIPTLLHALCAISLITDAGHLHAGEMLAPEPPLKLAGTKGRFDFLAVDTSGRRLLAAHTGNASLDIIDIDQSKLVKAVPTGKAQAPAIHPNGKTYYVTSSEPPGFLSVDAGTLEVTGKTPLTGPADLAAFESNSGKAYVGHDDGKELWVVDPAEKKVVGSIALPGEAPEDLAFDQSRQRLFQCMKTGSVVAVINVAETKVVEKWPTLPAESPHGMAIVPEADAFLVAGGNGKLVMMSQKDGHVLASADIPPRVDQIAYDSVLHRVYCASGTGKISITAVEDGKLQPLGTVASSEGCHSIAVDPKSHSVWIAYAKGEESFVQQFKPAKQ